MNMLVCQRLIQTLFISMVPISLIFLKKNNITIARKDMMPMNCDLLKIEFFF